jgi:hypothetical protein
MAPFKKVVQKYTTRTPSSLSTETNLSMGNDKKTTAQVTIKITVTPPTPTDEICLSDLLSEQAGDATIIRASRPKLQRRDSYHSICSPIATGFLEVPKEEEVDGSDDVAEFSGQTQEEARDYWAQWKLNNAS